MLAYRAPRLSVVTFNVTREPLSASKRHAALTKLLETLRPDVVFWQEVTSLFLARLCELDYVRQSYYLSDAAGTQFGERKCGQVRAGRVSFRGMLGRMRTRVLTDFISTFLLPWWWVGADEPPSVCGAADERAAVAARRAGGGGRRRAQRPPPRTQLGRPRRPSRR
jgi:hypothetical protein